MSYWEYEIKVLSILDETLRLKSVNIDTDEYESWEIVKHEIGELGRKVFCTNDTGDYIVLNFGGDFNYFHYAFLRKELREAYGQGYSEEEIADLLMRDIRSEYADLLYKKQCTEEDT